MGIKTPYYLLDPTKFIPENNERPLLGRFITDFRCPDAHPKVGDLDDIEHDLLSIIKPLTNSFAGSEAKFASNADIAASISAPRLVAARFQNSASQILDLSHSRIAIRALRNPGTAFEQLVKNDKIKDILEDLLAESKVYMITGYRIISSGLYSRTIVGTREVGGSMTFPVSSVLGIPNIDPSMEVGQKTRVEASETIEITEPHIYAIQCYRVGRPTKFPFQRPRQLGLKDMIRHDVSDGTFGDEDEDEDDNGKTEDEYGLVLLENSDEEDDNWGCEEICDTGHLVYYH
jgi:hypothetical protein